MISGNRVINFFLYFFLLAVSLIQNTLSEEIQISPLLNLDEISPSYEDVNEEDSVQPNDNLLLKQAPHGAGEIKFVSLSILNKITATVKKVDVEIKENYIYDNLRIFPIFCKINTPDERPEVSSYLNIYDRKTNNKIFAGWMLKSLPSISSMEHSLYDIWINDCI